MSSTLDEQSDEELVRRYQDEATDNYGEPFMAIYMRYLDTVRVELEAAGLSPADAENRVGAVFIRALNDPPQRDKVPLRERLFALAREIGVPTIGTPSERILKGLTDGKGMPRIPLRLDTNV